MAPDDRAFDALGLTAAEQREAARHLDTIQGDGKPWNKDIPAAAVPWPTGPRKETK